MLNSVSSGLHTRRSRRSRPLSTRNVEARTAGAYGGFVTVHDAERLRIMHFPLLTRPRWGLNSGSAALAAVGILHPVLDCKPYK